MLGLGLGTQVLVNNTAFQSLCRWFVDENKCAESNPLLSPIIVISLLAGVLIIVAVTLLITLLKQRADVKGFAFCIAFPSILYSKIAKA